VIVCFVDIGGIDEKFKQLKVINSTNIKKTNNQLPSYLTEHKQESLNSNGHQFHQYQKNKQSTLILTH
jgi:hypothetical protein